MLLASNNFNPYLVSSTINISFVKDIDDSYPYRMAYQNNQGRIVSLDCTEETIDITTPQSFHFCVENIVSFYWVNNHEDIKVLLHVNNTEVLVKYWYLHILLPIFYSLNGKYNFLHTGSVLIDKQPILFMAQSFGGKSTITDYFLQKGHTLITDDKLATFDNNGEFMAVPSIPFHRPYRKVEDFGIYVENFATKAYKINIIYQLNKVDADANITFNEVRGLEKFSFLHKGSEMNFGFNMKNHVPYLSKLANKVKLFKIDMPWNLNRQEEVYQSILEHLKKVQNET